MKPAEHYQQMWEQWLNMGCPLLPPGRKQDGLPFFPLLPKLPPLSGCLSQIVKDYLDQRYRCNGYPCRGLGVWGVPGALGKV